MGDNYIAILSENKQNCILGAPHASNTSWQAHIFVYTTHMHMHNNFWGKWLWFGRVSTKNIFVDIASMFKRIPGQKKSASRAFTNTQIS